MYHPPYKIWCKSNFVVELLSARFCVRCKKKYKFSSRSHVIAKSMFRLKKHVRNEILGMIKGCLSISPDKKSIYLYVHHQIGKQNQIQNPSPSHFSKHFRYPTWNTSTFQQLMSSHLIAIPPQILAWHRHLTHGFLQGSQHVEATQYMWLAIGVDLSTATDGRKTANLKIIIRIFCLVGRNLGQKSGWSWKYLSMSPYLSTDRQISVLKHVQP